ncbi:MAG: FAD-binding oxidoreductase [Chitinophagaceae bacterium]|nr:MAG: FAD-binding oxidoreductase [Chitinophagaceae bacterium]
MYLHTPDTYSLRAAGHVPAYTALDSDLRCEVLVLGTGISGALTAWKLQQAGFHCTLIDRRAAAMGSTVASTSLLQYELDTSLCELSDRIGNRAAQESYRLCYEAIDGLEQVCADCGAANLFEPRNSVQWASSRRHLPALREEVARRKAIGFDVELLGSKALADDYFLQKPGGLFSSKAAQIDAFALTHRLLAGIVDDGGAVYTHTEAVHIDWQREGISVRTSTGHHIEAQRLVIACGYESQRYLPKPVEELFVTYVQLSEPMSPEAFWKDRALLWETAHPYLYLRTTTDNRLIIGGKDDPYDGRPGFPALRRKAKALQRSVEHLLPGLPFRPALSWAGIFAGTTDGLPYIGSVPGQPHTAYALGFGGNGILFSVLAADIIVGLFKGHKPQGASLFSFNR